ncbi:MAG TPA: VWA domain-containing protein [Verrucomicrobia bacterium]|nr:VWA domain-containing protein [Verrucomicrobiota bacterium]
MNWIGFTTPWMLAGLAAVGLPVLIHYLTRARPRRIPFPPLRFLAEACAGQQAVHRLRTLLLLTLRCLAVLALVLLFARPFLKPKQSVAASESARRVVVVIDASLSMRAVQQGVTLFARAQAEAADVLRGLDANSEAGVILAGARPRPLLPALSRNIPALHEELVKAKASFEAGDPALALTLAKQMLGGAGTVFVFSDFQRANWEKVGELPGGIVWKLRNVAEELMENVAITSTRLVPAQPVVGEPAEVVCTVFNCSSRPRQETVRIELGDITHSTGVSVPPFGSAEVAFNVTFPRPGPVWGRVSLQPDQSCRRQRAASRGQPGESTPGSVDQRFRAERHAQRGLLHRARIGALARGGAGPHPRAAAQPGRRSRNARDGGRIRSGVAGAADG